MKKTTTYCDRCGKEIESGNYDRVTVWKFRDGYLPNKDNPIEITLCTNCAEEYYLKNQHKTED